MPEDTSRPVVPEPDDSVRVGDHDGLGGFGHDRTGKPCLVHGAAALNHGVAPSPPSDVQMELQSRTRYRILHTSDVPLGPRGGISCCYASSSISWRWPGNGSSRAPRTLAMSHRRRCPLRSPSWNANSTSP